MISTFCAPRAGCVLSGGSVSVYMYHTLAPWVYNQAFPQLLTIHLTLLMVHICAPQHVQECRREPSCGGGCIACRCDRRVLQLNRIRKTTFKNLRGDVLRVVFGVLPWCIVHLDNCMLDICSLVPSCPTLHHLRRYMSHASNTTKQLGSTCTQLATSCNTVLWQH